MIVCTNCGNHNEDNDEFCGSCGKFLEWVGQRIETPAPAPEVEAAPEPEQAKAGLIDRVKAAVGIDDGSHGVAATGGTPASGSPGVAPPGAAPGVDGEAAARQAEEARRRAEEEERAYQEAESARRAQQEAEAAAAERAEAARLAESQARRHAEDEARARAEAEQRREAEAEAARRADQERRAVAAAEADAAAAAAAARQSELDARAQAEDSAAQAAAEAEAARHAAQAAAAAATLEEAKRAEERARLEAEAEARALQEAQLKERQEAEARRAAEEHARQQAAEEARAKAAAAARAREEEAARTRAAALLQRARPAPAAVPDDPPAPPGVAGPATPAAMLPSTPAPVRPAAQRPVAQQPVAQQPSSTRTPPRPDPKVKAAEKVLKPGDLVCGQCGEGNDPTRKFCRKCGNSLAQAAPAKKVPWWKKLFSRKARVSKEAGARGSKVRAAKEASFKVQIFLNTLRRVMMILAFLGVAGAFAVPSARTLILDKGTSGLKAAQNLFNPQFEPVNAVEVSASSAVEGHGANFANDLGSNTYWAEGAEGEGIGQTISFSFETKVDLTKVIVSSGATDSPDNFLKQPRPKRLHLVFDNGGSADIVLKDQFKPQGFGLKGAKGVSKVDIAIVEVYKGQSGSDTAIAEVEFKKKG